MGLFDYPALMAADILLYKAEAVPVGEDQAQHVELTRLAARKFNQRFGEFFTEPKVLLTEGARVMGLDGKYKMSASRENEIGLFEDPESIRQKINPAKTDPARKTKTDPGDPAKCNLYSWHQIFSDKKTQEEVAEKCRGAKWGCLDCKKVLADNLIKEISPLREKYLELKNKPDFVKDVLRDGEKKAGKIAAANLAAIKDKMGFLKL
jgi:tryptophanyl-tRNA synthetase